MQKQKTPISDVQIMRKKKEYYFRQHLHVLARACTDLSVDAQSLGYFNESVDLLEHSSRFMALFEAVGVKQQKREAKACELEQRETPAE